MGDSIACTCRDRGGLLPNPSHEVQLEVKPVRTDGGGSRSYRHGLREEATRRHAEFTPGTGSTGETCLQSPHPGFQVVAPALFSSACSRGNEAQPCSALWAAPSGFGNCSGFSPGFVSTPSGEAVSSTLISLPSVRDLRGFRASEAPLNWVTNPYPSYHGEGNGR